MKHISFLMGAALSFFALGAKAQPTNFNQISSTNLPTLTLIPASDNDQSLTLLAPKGSFTNTQAINFGATICVPIVVKFDTNVMVLTTQPQHQRPPEIEKTTYVKVFTIRRNVFADWTWVDSDGHTNREMKLLESKVIKESHRSFRITTKEEYLEEVK